MSDYICERVEPDESVCGSTRPCPHHEPHMHDYVLACREERARIVAAIRKLRQQRLLGQKPDKPWNGQDWADWIEKGCPDGE